MGKIGKSIGRLIAFSAFAAWFTFTIWGIVDWNATTSLVTNKTLIVLLYVPFFIGMFILFIIVMAIGGISKANKKRKEKKKEKEGGEIKGLGDLKKLEDVKDFEDFKAMIPDKWKEKFKDWVDSQEK
ncbi:MAG: hypothetical protein ACTSQF_06605 [Candidatus Heimdallarchaeaceae archaeon]